MPPTHAAPAGVCVEQAEAHARVALHAVEEVNPQALPAPAHVAEGAVVDRTPRLVVPQVADATVVGSQLGVAGRTRACRHVFRSHSTRQQHSQLIGRRSARMLKACFKGAAGQGWLLVVPGRGRVGLDVTTPHSTTTPTHSDRHRLTCHWLAQATQHALHFTDSVAVQPVVTRVIMAQPAAAHDICMQRHAGRVVQQQVGRQEHLTAPDSTAGNGGQAPRCQDTQGVWAVQHTHTKSVELYNTQGTWRRLRCFTPRTTP